jgi:hypothetical protein
MFARWRLVLEFLSLGVSSVTITGMSQKARERAALDALLKHLRVPDAAVPELITESERPDFVIRVNGETIGVEVTTSAYEEYIRAMELHAAEYPERWINTTNFKNRSPRRTNDQLSKSMGYNALLQPWKSVKSARLDWTLKIEARLDSKRRKFNQPDFRVFEKNWLLIHDYPPLPTDDHVRSQVEEHLSHLFRKQSALARDFDTVFIHSGNYLYCWDRELLYASPHA